MKKNCNPSEKAALEIAMLCLDRMADEQTSDVIVNMLNRSRETLYQMTLEHSEEIEPKCEFWVDRSPEFISNEESLDRLLDHLCPLTRLNGQRQELESKLEELSNRTNDLRIKIDQITEDKGVSA